MRLHSITIQGLTTYTDAQTVDFHELPPGLIAVQGTNGSGKTTLLEAPFAALHRTFPTRPGSLYDYATGEARIEASFQDGADTIMVRLLIDPNRRTSEGYVVVNGEPVTDGKAGPFAEAIDRYFGSARLMLASVFASQDKSGSVTAMKTADRKSLFVELLGLGVLETLAERARQRAAELTRQCETHRLMRERAVQELRDTPEADVDASKEALKLAREAKDAADKRLAESMRQAEEQRKARERIATLEREERDARKRTEQATKHAADQRQSLDRLTKRHASLTARLADAPDPDVVRRAVEDAQTRMDAAQAIAQEQQRVQARVTDYAQREAAAKRILREVESTRLRELGQAEETAALIDEVPCSATDRWVDELELREPDDPDTNEEAPVWNLAGDCPLLAQAREAKRRIPVLSKRSKQEIDAESRLEEHRRELAAARKRLDELPDGDTVMRTIDAARREYDEARAGQVQIAAIAEVREALNQCEADIERARARHQESEDAAEEANNQHERARAALDEAKAQGAIETVDVRGAEREVEATAKRVTEAEVGLHRAQDARERIDRLVRERDDHEANLRAAGTNLSDATLLAESLGRDGVQALEIDAAAPEVTELANELLTVYPGRQFSVRIDTLRTKRDGTQAESFAIVIYEGAYERPIEALSGGERVVVGEALSLALAILNARKNSIRWETLWRDETAGALDPDAADAYVAMLRRARELGGFHQVVYVAHQREVWEQADAVVRVENGTVDVKADSVAA